mmetsp:Transcript_4668/g.7932  ORF Transcript_4668/g.7932 Transcript_4668/m.7932 type:complete len:193 (-) Transcript_4668:685-1263(-)
MKESKLMITVERYEGDNFTCEYYALEQWVEAVKKTLRPMWVDPQILNCHICEREFKKVCFKLIQTTRQHHCRKCGVAVCSDCSKFFSRLPELAYYKPVRLCKNCFECKYQHTKQPENYRTLTQIEEERVSMGGDQFIESQAQSRSKSHNLLDPNMASNSNVFTMSSAYVMGINQHRKQYSSSIGVQKPNNLR